jgi:phage baseplate assembly protein V
MLPNSGGDGFVDGSFYNTGNPPPITDPNTRHIKHDDGGIFEYTEKAPPGVSRRGTAVGTAGSGTLTIKPTGPINVTTPVDTTIICANLIVTGNVHITGDVLITGNLTVTGVSKLQGGGTATPKMTNSDGSGGGS